MEVIAATIRSSLVPFLAEKLGEYIDVETIQSYVDEWLNNGKPGKTTKKRTSQKAKKEVEVVQPVERDDEHDDERDDELRSRAEYEKMKVTDLKVICKERGLSCVGTKATLIDKILGETKSEKKTSPKKTSPKKTSPKHSDTEKKPRRKPKKDDEIISDDEDEQPPKRKLTKKRVDTNQPKVIEKIQQITIDIVTDKFGNDIHEETGLVFNRDNEVVGHVNDEGDVMPLTKSDIDLCRRYNFSCIRDSDFNDEE